MTQQSPEEWWPQFQAAMLAGNPDAVMRLYEPDAAFAAAQGEISHGHDEMRAQFDLMASARADFEVTLEKLIQADDLALLVTGWRTTRPRQASGIALEVLRRQEDGRWLLAIGDPFTIGRLIDRPLAD